MAVQQLVDYIKKAREADKSDEETRSMLYKNGWTEVEVDEALFSIDHPDQSVVASPKPTPEEEPDNKKFNQTTYDNTKSSNFKTVKTMNKLILLFLILILCTITFAGGYFFHMYFSDNLPKIVNTTVSNPSKIEGEVIAVGDNNITVLSDDGTYNVLTKIDTEVYFENLNITTLIGSLSDIKVGQQVTLSTEETADKKLETPIITIILK